jgi:histone H1/5
MRDASVGTTRAQAADVTAAVGASLQGAVPATRSQSGYPGSVETISDSAQQVALQHKPAGTIWPQQDKTKGLPTGLLIGVIGGLVLALAAVGATVLGDRFLDQSEQTQDSSERAARQTSPAPQADEEALAEGVTGSQDPAATPSPQPTKTKPAAKTKPVAKAKPKAPIAKSPQVNIAASGDLKQRLDRLPVMKPKAKTKAVTSPQDSTAAAESRGRVKTGAVTSSQHDTPAQIVKKEAASKGTIRKSNHRRKASSASSSILDELDQHYVRRPKWVWETNSDDGRRRGYFILHSKGMAELEAVIEVNLPGGIDKKLKMSPSGGAGEAQIWRSKIAFPKQTSGTVKWQVQIRAKRTDGENIKRRYEGKDFRL